MATTMTQRPPRYEPMCPINAIGEGATPLMYACQQARDAEVRSILANKPGTALERDRTRKTPLHYCAENSTTACAELLLNASPTLLDERDEDGYTALHLGVIAGNRPLIKLLLSRGANVNSLDNERHSVVHWATVCGEVEALELVLDAGADPSTPDIHGGYPIHYAAQMCGPNSEMGNDVRFGLAVLRKLLARGVAVDVADQDGRQPILWAASAGSADAILALVNAGANVEADDKDGLTALHCAASRGHTDCLETLVTLCGAEVDVIDSNGCTALFYSVTLGHADSTRLLLGYGAEPNRQDRKGRTPAHCGAAKGQLETLRILGSHGANLWVRNVKGDYPLHEAVASGRKDLVRWLLNQRPDAVNSPNNDGRCPLHIAAINNNMEMCKIVLDYQALLNSVMRTSKGQLMTPMDAALHRGNRGCAKYLQLHGGVPASKLTDKAAKIKGGSHRQAVSESQSEPYTTPDCVQTIPLPRGGISLASSPMGELLHDPRRSESRTLQVRLNDDVAIRHVERIDPPVVCRHRTYDDDSSEEERLRRRRRRRRREHRRMEYSLDRDSDITDEESRRRRRHGRRRREPSDTDSEEQRHARRRRRGRTRSSEDSDSENERVRYKRRSHVSYQDSDSEHRRSTRSRSSKRKTKKNESDDEEEDDEEEELAQQDEDEAESSSADTQKKQVHDKRHIEKTETQKKSKTVNNQTLKKKQEKKQKTSKDGVSSDQRGKKEVIKESQEKEIKVQKTKSKTSDSRTKVTETETHHSEAEVEEKSESLSKQSSEGGTRSSREDANSVIVTHQVVTALVHREERHSRSEREEGSGSLSAKEEGSSKQDTDFNNDQGEELDERKSNGEGSLDKISTVHSSDPEKESEDKIADNETNQEPDNDVACVKDSTESDKGRKNDLALDDDEKLHQNESSHDDATEEQKTALSKSNDSSPAEVTVDQQVIKSSEGENEVDKHTEEEQEDSSRRLAEGFKEESKSNDDEEIVDHAITSDKEAIYDAEREVSAEEMSKATSSGEKESDEGKLSGAVQERMSRKETENESTESVSEKEFDIVRKSSKSDRDEAGVEDSVLPDEGVQGEEGTSDLGGEKFNEEKSTEDGKEQIVTDEKDAAIKAESLEKDRGDSDDFEDDLEGEEEEEEGEEEEEEKQVGVEDEEDEDVLDEDDTQIDTHDSISIKQQDSIEQASISSKDEETILKPALSGREERRKASQDQHKPHDSGGEHERADVESESEVQELDKDSTERTLSSRSRNGDSGFEPSPRRDKPEKPVRARSQPHGRIPRPCRDGVSDDERPDISTVSVTQAVQNSMRKYHMERRIFQQLLELKRLQIRAGRANENVLVKRLVDDYRRAGLIVGLRHYDGPYTFRSFEKYLYVDQLRLLQTSERRMVPRLQSSDDLDKLHAVLRRARLNNKLLGDIPDNPVLCTQGTHRCHHAAHAYTGVPCAAYITKPNHHHKQSPPKSGGFLPRIDSTSSRGATRSLRYVDPAKPVTLELSHGNDKQVISLPTEKLDKNKRYYVTFTIKGGQNGKDETKVQEEDATMRHRHAKSL